MPHGHVFTFLRNLNREIFSIIVSFTNVYHFWEKYIRGRLKFLHNLRKIMLAKIFFIRSQKQMFVKNILTGYLAL